MKVATLRLTQVLLLAALACGNSRSKADASASAAAARSAERAAWNPPVSIDPAVVAEIKKLQACDFSEEKGFGDSCAMIEDDGIIILVRSYANGKPSRTIAARTLAVSCLSLIADPDPKLRLGSAECLRWSGLILKKDDAAHTQILTQLAAEKNALIRLRISWVLIGLELVGENVPPALELIKGAKTGNRTDAIAVGLLDALAEEGVEPAPAAFDLAVALVDDENPDVVKAAIGLLATTLSRKTEACPPLARLVTNGAPQWPAAAETIGKLAGVCSGEAATVAGAITARLGEDASTPPKGVQEDDVAFIKRFIEAAKLGPTLKADMKAAVQARASKATRESEKARLRELAAALEK